MRSIQDCRNLAQELASKVSNLPEAGGSGDSTEQNISVNIFYGGFCGVVSGRIDYTTVNSDGTVSFHTESVNGDGQTMSVRRNSLIQLNATLYATPIRPGVTPTTTGINGVDIDGNSTLVRLENGNALILIGDSPGDPEFGDAINFYE